MSAGRDSAPEQYPSACGPDAENHSEPPRTPVFTLTVLFLINVLNYYDRQVLGALVEPLRRQFHLNDTQLAAIPTAVTVIYAIAGLPLGRLADRVSRKWLLAAGVTAWAALTGLGAIASSYAMLLVSRLGMGVGEAACAPVATSWLGDAVPPLRRARAMGGFMMAVPVGVMLSLAVSGPVAQRWGWRSALVVAALPALALVPALLCLREPRRGLRQREAASFQFLSLPTFWWISLSGAVVNAALYTISYFLPAFLMRYHGLSVGVAGLWSGIGSGVAGIAGALAVSTLGDRITRGQAGKRLQVTAIASAIAVAPLLAALLAPPGSGAQAAVLAICGYGLLQVYYGLVYAALQDIVPPGSRGTAMSVYLLVTYLCGASFGPLLTGRLSDYFARAAAMGRAVTEAARASGLHQAMYVAPVLCALLAAVLWAGSRSAMQNRR